MTPTQHQHACQRTKSGLRININEGNEDLLHAALGIASEAGEFTDQLKKHLFYGAPLDIVNLQEEAGDILWYLSIFIEWSGGNYEEIMERNIEKLRIRYPEKFSLEASQNRKLDAERKVLEGRIFISQKDSNVS